MELYNKFKSPKNKYYSKALNNSTTNIKNINNDSLKYINQFSPKTSNQKNGQKNNLNQAFPIRYKYQNYRNDQKYIKNKYDSKSYNHISLKKNNIIKINLKLKCKSKSKSQSNNIKYNNKSLLLSERIKNKSLNILSGFNSDNKIKEKNINFINNGNMNLLLNNNNFVLNNKILTPKTTRKNSNNNNNDFDLEKNFKYFKELQNKIKELQNNIEKTKKNLNINEKNISKNKKEEKNISSKIEDLSLLNNKINKINNNKNESKNPLNNKINNNSNIKKEKKNDYNNEKLKNKNESKKTQSNNSLFTILNYNSKYKHNINHKNSKKKKYIMQVFSKKIFNTDKYLNLPIKNKKNNKSKNKSKNSTRYNISKNISIKKNSDIHKNYIYNNYMTMTPNNNKKIIKININTHKTPNIKTTKNKKIIFNNKTPKLAISNSCQNLYSFSSSKIYEERKNKKIKCLRNKNLNNSSNISNISHKDNIIIQYNIVVNKKIIKNASICRVGKNRENETIKINQDNLFKIKYEDLNLFFYGVCDGHGPFGHLVSNFIKTNLPIILYQNLCNQNLKEKDKDINYNDFLYNAIRESFSQIDYKLGHNSNINIDFSGSTCISILFNNNQIIMANVGDSKAIKGQYIAQNNKWIFEILNKEHKPENKEEYLRIKKSNGIIHPYLNEENEYIGPQRVWINNKNIPGLAMSRSFGDKFFTSIGVISKPDILFFKHKIIDKFIVIASDGLWMYVSNQEVVDILGKYYEKLNCDEAIEELYVLAKSRFKENDDFIDDITIIILFLG